MKHAVNCTYWIGIMAQECSCGLAEQQRLVSDAKRYRFLRDRAWPFEFKGDNPEDADAAIDAAMNVTPSSADDAREGK